MHCCAIIPARGGSKGIPNKNLQTVHKKPLLVHSILHAQRTPQIERVFVSTDCDKIAQVSKGYGAEVISRPPYLATDEASSESALLHTLDWLKTESSYNPEWVAFLQATSPLRASDDLEKALQLAKNNNFDSLFSACVTHGFVWEAGQEQLRSLTYEFSKRPRRQDIDEHLTENGSFYIFKPWVLRQNNNRLGGKIGVYRMSPLHSFQIDNPKDIAIMETLFAISSPPVSICQPTLAAIKLLVLDFDGVLTDNCVWVDKSGKESVCCNRSDGLAIHRLKKYGLQIIVLSSETNPVVRQRCKKLDIACIQASTNKLTDLKRYAKQQHIKAKNIAYVGNDVNDIEVMQWCDVSIAVADAVPKVLERAQLVTAKPGGSGVLVEIADWFGAPDCI